MSDGTRRTYNGVGQNISASHAHISGVNHNITGNHNSISGCNHNVKGNLNKVRGANHNITGDYNTISGANSNISGKDNKISGVGHKVNGKTMFSQGGTTFTQKIGGNNFGNVIVGGNMVQNFGPSGWEQWIDGKLHSVNGVVLVDKIEKKEDKKKKLFPDQNDLHLDQVLPEGSPDKDACIICFERIRMCMVKPCNHFSVCVKCSLDLVTNFDKLPPKKDEFLRCPSCNTYAEAIEIVYIV